MDQKVLEIVIRARNEAQKALNSAQSDIEKLTNTFKENIGTAGVMAGGLAAGLGVMAKSFIDNASAMEQNKIAFTTFLQDGEKAGQLLKQLGDFATQTPFDLPQVQDGAKRLLAYGVEAEKIIPTFRMLGDISAGVGTDKLPQLILAFGQVKAATKLTGAELRQFSEAGVPLLEALVTQANATGGVLTKIGGLSEKESKRMGKLTTTIVDQEYRMKLLKDAGKDTGVSFQMFSKKLADNKAELQKYGEVGQATYQKVKVSAADMIEKISDGSVKFEDVNKALQGMTGEGGKFFDLMGKQSKSLGGIFSNIRDEFVRFSVAVMGITEEGDIKEGSIFYYLKMGADSFRQALTTIRPHVIGFFDTLLKNKDAISGIVGAFAGLVALIGVAFVSAFGGAMLVMGTFIAAGALIGVAVNQVVEKFGGWNTVLTNLKTKGEELQIWVQNHRTELENMATVIGIILLPKLIILTTQMGINFVLSIKNAIVSMVMWIAEGWRTVAVIMIKIIQLGILIAQYIIHAVVVGASAIATGVLTAATWLLNAALIVLTSPITLVILAIVALIAIGVLLWKNWDTVKAKAAEVGAWLKSKFEEARDAVSKAIDALMQKFEGFKQGIEDKVNKVIGFFRNMADGIMSALRSIKFPHLSLGEGSATVLGKEIKYPKLNVDWYEKGGFVPRTGLAMLHEGEYVISRAMAQGTQRMDSSITNNNNTPINITAYISDYGDIETLAQRLAFQFSTSGSL